MLTILIIGWRLHIYYNNYNLLSFSYRDF